MISGVLTLFHWTLRMDSRSIHPHLVRGGFAFAMLFAISLALVDIFGASRTGLRLFESVCYMNVLLITVSGISYFVTAVTEEKDSGTFALLRLAGMNSLSITLGKSTSRLVSSLMLLIVQLPFTFLSVTLGGVLWQQIVAAYLALAAWMAFVANLSLFCSVRCTTSGRAAALSGSVLLLFFSLPSIAGGFTTALPAGMLAPGMLIAVQRVADSVHQLSILTQLNQILSVNREIPLFSAHSGFLVAAAFGFFVLSTLTLDFWSAPADVSSLPEHPVVRRWAVGRVWSLPVVWKEYQYFTGGHGFALAKLIGGGLLLIGFQSLQVHRGEFSFLQLQADSGWELFLIYTAILTLEILLYSSGCLFFELRQSTQSTLATLPMSGVRILIEKFLGCLLALLPVVFWMIVTLVMGYRSISQNCSATMLISYLIMMGFGSHMAALFSLYTRWAALPLTILVTVPAFFCLAAPILGISSATLLITRASNLPFELVLIACVNLFWTWLFVLLPLQFWIRDRWMVVVRE